jgi:hypothetical protein
MANKVKAIIEMGKDGLFSAYTDYELDGYSFGGFGNSAKEAKEDFMLSMREAIESVNEETSKDYKVEDFVIEWKYDIPSVFGIFEYINITKFANAAGINASKMRQYARGIAYPSEKTVQKIASTINTISKDLSMVRF